LYVVDTAAALVRSGVVRAVRAIAPLLARMRWYVPADSIEDAMGIRKESVTVLAVILTTLGTMCGQGVLLTITMVRSYR
jgi:hypothetical protein